MARKTTVTVAGTGTERTTTTTVEQIPAAPAEPTAEMLLAAMQQAAQDMEDAKATFTRADEEALAARNTFREAQRTYEDTLNSLHYLLRGGTGGYIRIF